MTVQRSPQVSLEEYYEKTPFRECLDTMFREQPLKSSLAILGLLGLAFGFGFFIAVTVNPSASTAPKPETVSANPAEIARLRSELERVTQKADADLAELRSKQEADLKAMKANYDSDLVYANEQVKKYLDLMGKSPESRKRETFLNLYLSYQTAVEISKSSPLPMTTDEKHNAAQSLQRFLAANLSLNPTQQEAAGLVFMIQPKGDKFDLAVECGGVLRAIAPEVSDGLQEQLKAAAKREKPAGK